MTRISQEEDRKWLAREYRGILGAMRRVAEGLASAGLATVADVVYAAVSENAIYRLNHDSPTLEALLVVDTPIERGVRTLLAAVREATAYNRTAPLLDVVVALAEELEEARGGS